MSAMTGRPLIPSHTHAHAVGGASCWHRCVDGMDLSREVPSVLSWWRPASVWEAASSQLAILAVCERVSRDYADVRIEPVCQAGVQAPVGTCTTDAPEAKVSKGHVGSSRVRPKPVMSRCFLHSRRSGGWAAQN
jgi:hypothetical protein